MSFDHLPDHLPGPERLEHVAQLLEAMGEDPEELAEMADQEGVLVAPEREMDSDD